MEIFDMKRLWIIPIILVAWLPFFIAAWDNTLPGDSSTWNAAAGYIRNNNDALEVVLGVDLGMEGSAYPWYQAAAPTTKADSSTAIDATDNGFLWIDSDTRILYAYVHGTGFVQLNIGEAVVTFTDSDTTPTVALSSAFLTNTTGVTISRFDDGVAGQEITIISKGAIVFDTSPADRLIGSSVDITTASGDVTHWICETGGTASSVWRLIGWTDVSADNS